MDDRRVIVYTIDDNQGCVDQLKKSIHSVRTFLECSVDIIICTSHPDTFYDFDVEEIIDVNKEIEEYGLDSTRATWHGRKCSPMMLYRMALPVTEGLKKYDEVLYLDSDTEIWDARALDIFDIPHDDCDVVGIRDHVSQNTIRSRVGALRDWCKTAWATSSRTEELLSGIYANSGVLLFNLKRMRERMDADKFLRDVLKIFNEQPPRYPDQETINLLYDIKVVDRFEFNWWPGVIDTCPRYIRHYVGRHYDTKWDKMWRPKVLDKKPKVEGVGKNVPDIFDKIFLICCTTNIQRGEQAARELDRLGLRYEKIWQFPTPFDKYFTDGVPHTDEFDRNVNFTSNWFGHYRAIKTAYEMGCRRALILEDDCRFLKDIDKLNSIVRDLPYDFDLALLDHFFCKWNKPDGRQQYEKMLGDSANENWSRFDGDLYSAACYAISRRFMERNIWLHESVIDPRTYKRMMRITDNWHNKSVLGSGMNLYFCKTHCAIQRNSNTDTSRLSPIAKMNYRYECSGVKFNDYAE